MLKLLHPSAPSISFRHLSSNPQQQASRTGEYLVPAKSRNLKAIHAQTLHAQNLTSKLWSFQKTKSDGNFLQLSFCTERSHSARYTSSRGLEGRRESSTSNKHSRFRLRLQEPSVWRRGLPSGKNFKRQKMPATSRPTELHGFCYFC